MFRSTKTTPPVSNGQTYIPPHIEGAMAEHVQQSMPAHLQKYRGGNTFIPEHAQDEMTRHLENAVPSHMKQYAGAYMQQRVVEPSLARRAATTPPTPPPEPAAAPAAPGVAPAVPASQNPQSQSPEDSYAFITNPEQPKGPSKFSGLFTASLPIRIGLLAGGLLILVVLFVIMRGLLSNAPDMTPFVTIAQEQQELIHLVSNTPNQQHLSSGSRNLAATMNASLISTQGATIQYLTNNHKKLNEKQLNLKISAETDTQLTDAAAAGTYNTSFNEVIQAKLNAYANTLQQTYKKTTGKNGRTLLENSYQQAQLFQVQLDQATN